MDFDAIIKAAVKRQLEALGGDVAAGQLVSMGKTQLSNYSNADRPERIPLTVALRLDEAAGNPLILNAAAALLGCRLARAGDGGGDILTALGSTAGTAGQLLAEGYAAAADHTFSPAERRQMAKRAMDLQAALAALVTAIGAESE
jgi:hypothetical protein